MMPGYVYRGSEFDAHLPLTDPEPKPVRPTVKCGTRSGYMQHKKHKEAACFLCIEADRAYKRAYTLRRASREIRSGFDASKCGTPAGYSAHRYHAVPMCEPCRIANSNRQKAYKVARKAAA